MDNIISEEIQEVCFFLSSSGSQLLTEKKQYYTCTYSQHFKQPKQRIHIFYQ